MSFKHEAIGTIIGLCILAFVTVPTYVLAVLCMLRYLGWF